MKIKYDVSKLQKLMEDITILTGISVSFIDTERNYLSYCGNNHVFCETFQQGDNAIGCHCDDDLLYQKCKASGCFESHICHAGLFDAMLPVNKNGVTVGYIIFGRVRTSKSPKNPYQKGTVLQKLYDEVPFLSDRQVESLKSLLPEVLFENAIFFEFDEIAEMIESYIGSHLNEELSVEAICKHFFISKNSLYKMFRTHYGCTITDYIIKKRMQKAKELLEKTESSVYMIAESVGVHNHTYFCRLFKQKEGVSPMQYRKMNQKTTT